MASSTDNQPPQLQSEDSLNIRQIQELIDYFDEIKKSLSNNPDGDARVSSAIGLPNPPKVPIHLPDDAACVPCWIGHADSDMGKAEIGGGRATDDSNKNGHDVNDQKKLIAQAEKLQRELCNVKRELSNFRKLDDVVASSYRVFAGNRLDMHTVPDAVARLEGTLRMVAEMVQNLKRQVKAAEEPFALTFEPYYLVLNEKNGGTGMKNGIENASYYRNYLYNDLLGMFKELNDDSRKCLMYFSVFPENAVLRKSLLKNWWIGEGLFANNTEGRGKVDKVLNQLLEKGFIEPFLKKRMLAGFKVDPLIRFVLIKIAEEGEFSRFDPMGAPSDGISPTGRAFLVKHGEDYSHIALAKNVPHQDLGKLKTLFNVNDSYPDFKEDWFSKLRNLEVLSLGGLHGSFGPDIQDEDSQFLKGAENIKNLKFKGPRGTRCLLRQHIEVEDVQFLKGMKNMKKLKFLGLQGISRLMKIPESIGNLSSLAILDLCACHNLESLPKGLVKLKNLTHLDLSECYLLDLIPKGVASLSKLQVLKGFLIGSSTSADSCTLSDLKSLTELRKLSIYTNNHKFPGDKDLAVLRGFKSLENLAIVWGGKFLKYEEKVRKGKSDEIPDEAHISKKLSKDKVTEKDFKVGEWNDFGSVEESNPDRDSARASIPQVKGDGEIGSSKQSGKPVRPSVLEEQKNKAGPLQRILSGMNREGSVRMRNVEESNRMDKTPEDGEIGSSKQSGKPVTPSVLEEQKNKAGPLQRILSGMNREGSVRMRNMDNNTKQSDILVSAGPTQEVQTDGNTEIPSAGTRGIRKLELQCYPGTEMPSWVLNGKLKPQKKLYIGGGNLRSLGRGNPEWTISILRLKFLSDLELDWTELRKSFPKLVYLEKVRCPKLSLFPCDNTGVWWKRDVEEDALVSLKLGLPWSFLKYKTY